VPTLPARYFENVARVKAAAKETGIELVPALFGVGYSNDLLSNDPNLAEGLPVKDALFVVKDSVARHAPDPEVTLKDITLASRKAWAFVDENLIAENGGLRSDTTDANARMSQRRKVQPFRQYHVSIRIRTDGFAGGHAEIKVLAGRGAQLNHTLLHEKPAQDWRTHHITFNSLGHSEVQLYFGVWGGHRGTLWWSEPRIEECGLVNVLRRPGAPLVVKSEDGRVLAEGADFDPVADPKLGAIPYAGEYEPWHQPPGIRTRGLADGTRLRVSFFHPHIVHEGQVCACVSEPAFEALLRRQAGDVHKLWGASGYMMSHDEWRVMNWDDACQSRRISPGRIAAENVRACTGILQGTAPGARVVGKLPGRERPDLPLLRRRVRADERVELRTEFALPRRQLRGRRAVELHLQRRGIERPEDFLIHRRQRIRLRIRAARGEGSGQAQARGDNGAREQVHRARRSQFASRA
jgi:hypothetical protein